MTNPGLGQALVDLADEIQRKDHVDPQQTAAILRQVGESIDREFNALKRRIEELEAVPQRAKRLIGLGWTPT